LHKIAKIRWRVTGVTSRYISRLLIFTEN